MISDMIKVGGFYMKRRKNKQKKIWIIIAILLVMVVGVVIAFILNNQQKESVQEKEEEKTEQVENKEEKKENQAVNQPEETIEKKKVEQYEGEDPNSRNDLSGVVTFADKVDDKLMIRVNIDQYLESGECELILKKDDATIHSSIANIIDNASTASCDGFEVPLESLGGGKVDIIINLKAGERSGLIRGEVNL